MSYLPTSSMSQILYLARRHTIMIDHLERSGHCHLILENPVRLVASVRGNLIDRDDLVCSIAILIKGLVASDPIKGNVLNGVDYRLAERLGTGSIARVLRRVSTIGKGRLDRLNEDIRTIIGCCTVDIDGTVHSIILLDECLCRGILTCIDNSDCAKDGARRDAYR